MANGTLARQRMAESLAQKSMSQMTAIRRVTEGALAEVSAVHRYTVDTARRTLTEAERIQRGAGKQLTEPVFQQLTADYLDELTRITEAAGVDMLRIIDRALR